MPAEVVIGQLKQTPFWEDLLAAGHTTAYDTELMQGLMYGDPLPSDRWSSVQVPVLVLAGGASGEFMRNGAKALVEMLADASYGELEGQAHGAADDVLAAAIGPFLSQVP